MARIEETTRVSNMLREREQRWNRAASWTIGQSFAPWAYGVPRVECLAIEALKNRILEIGEDLAGDEYFDDPPERHLRAV
jgi:hypothetical protein